jgi:hypothetical protein
MTSGAKADGRFNNDAFIYDAAKNEYICPAGEALIWRYTNVEKGLKLVTVRVTHVAHPTLQALESAFFD